MTSKLDSVLEPPIQVAKPVEFINHSKWPCQNFQHIDPSGEVFHVIVSRLTYSLRGMNYEKSALPMPKLLPPDEQVDLIETDEFAGPINASTLLQESDYAPYKPKCDVLLVNAVAHAPGGKPMVRWPVGFKFGDTIKKRLQVTGPRHYERSVASLGTLQLTNPEPTTKVPLNYELAFGGPNGVAAHETVKPDDKVPPPDYYEHNPIGTGRLGHQKDRNWITSECERIAAQHREGSKRTATGRASCFTEEGYYKAPQIEAFDEPFEGEHDYPVVGLGPIGRWWLPRRYLAGTYDARWKATQWPKSPHDHDYRYWNCAPEDQQVDYPKGGEEITMVNLTASTAKSDGTVRFA
ncbi:MAG: DUF2169 family type VI secretion system accessory protein, partial [Casimicrobium sp.]